MKKFYNEDCRIRNKKYLSSCYEYEHYRSDFKKSIIMFYYDEFLEDHRRKALQYSDRKKILLFLQLMK